MATIKALITNAGMGDHTKLVTWTPVTSADSCDPIGPNYGDWADRCVQIAGTFDSATVKLQGSNDGTNYAELTDPQGNNISKTAAAIEAVTENTLYCKPTFAGGGGSQSLTVSLVMRRVMPNGG